MCQVFAPSSSESLEFGSYCNTAEYGDTGQKLVNLNEDHQPTIRLATSQDKTILVIWSQHNLGELRVGHV